MKKRHLGFVRSFLVIVLALLIVRALWWSAPAWFPIFKNLLLKKWFPISINLALAIFTGGLLLYVVFRDWLTGRYRKPDLDMIINLVPPHCHKTKGKFNIKKDNGKRSITRWADVYYYRIQVFNIGDAPAEDVEVFASSMTRQDNDGKFSSVPAFQPLNLRWSTIHEYGLEKAMYFPRINPGGIDVAKHCDLGEIIDPQRIGGDVDRADMELCLIMRPFTMGHILNPGTYRIKLTVGASNASPKSKQFEIIHTGKWYDNEMEMLEKGTIIKEV